MVTAARTLAQMRKRVKHVCAWCGKSFVGLKQKKHCSDACRQRSSRAKRKKRQEE